MTDDHIGIRSRRCLQVEESDALLRWTASGGWEISRLRPRNDRRRGWLSDRTARHCWQWRPTGLATALLACHFEAAAEKSPTRSTQSNASVFQPYPRLTIASGICRLFTTVGGQRSTHHVFHPHCATKTNHNEANPYTRTHRFTQWAAGAAATLG